MAQFACPECHKRVLTEHCPTCNWLYCKDCSLIIGPRNAIFIGAAKKRAEEAQRRRNGV